jgi:hypothetical protein
MTKLFHYTIHIPEQKIIPKHPQMEWRLFHLETLSMSRVFVMTTTVFFMSRDPTWGHFMTMTSWLEQR